MSGFPTSFHLGPLVFHTYGFGLAVATFVAYAYARRRLREANVSVEPFARLTFWLVVSGLVGGRLANIVTNWGYYHGHPGRWIALWQGGLSSFGALGVALAVGLFLQRRWWPDTPLTRFTDALVPAVVAGWALGRVLGPQFMVAGGGHLTHQWFGMHYAGQVGKRVPVPLIQGAEDGLLWLGLLAVERFRANEQPGRVTGVAMIVWGVVRSVDERLLLGQQSRSGSLGVQGAGIVLALAGVAVLLTRGRARRAVIDAGPASTAGRSTPP